MRKTKRYKSLKHQLSRERAEMKKRHLPSKRRRRVSLSIRRQDIVNRNLVNGKKPINKVSPDNLSLVDNTNAVIEYINDCKVLLHKKEKVVMDIENVQNLSPDAIALLAACANDANYSGKYGKLSGNAPKEPRLLKLFAESGFYKFVSSSKLMKSVQKQEVNLLHKESHFQVQPEIAKEACLYGTKHVFSSTEHIVSSIWLVVCLSASCVSSEDTRIVSGRPVTRFRPLTSIYMGSLLLKAEPIFIFMSSAVRSPIKRLCF